MVFMSQKTFTNQAGSKCRFYSWGVNSFGEITFVLSNVERITHSKNKSGSHWRVVESDRVQSQRVKYLALTHVTLV